MIRLLIFIILLPTITIAGDHPKTCAAQLDTYRNCLTANANHCSPLCAGVHVVLNPQVLATMTEAGQTVACDAMKLMSCSYQSWCCENREGQKTACVTEEQSYWQCIEQEAGCGPIDCEAVLEPSEPQEPEETEETEPPVIPPDTDPEEDDEEETKPPRPSNDTPRTCAAELKTYQKCVVSNPSKCRAACRDVDVILNPNLLATMENPARACYALNLKSCKFQEWCCKSPEGVATACENEQNAYWQCIEQEAGCGALTCETASGSTSEVATSTSVTARATKRPRTCPTQLQAYQQCVFANPKYCFPSCAKVDVIINPRMLAEMLSPTRACAAMKTMSCGYQLSACCKNHKGVEVACGAQKRAYWRCIEQKAGCGAIDCKKLNLPRISTSSTPMATMIEKTKLRKKSARVPQKETCKAELETMQECEVAKNCSRDCGETVVEDNSYEPILNLCWMQGCCERCETEQTGYLQCLERQTECSLDCRMNLDELEESEEYEAAGDAAPSLARSFQGVFTLCLAAFVLLQ